MWVNDISKVRHGTITEVITEVISENGKYKPYNKPGNISLYINVKSNHPPNITGAQPDIFQGRGGFVKLGHFDKHFIKKSRRKATQGKILEFFLLDTLKTTFWIANLT